MRKLASIQKIREVLPIEGADRIELVKVLGWQCVCGKGDFQPGDLCVYFEVDSFLPVREEFEMLRKSSYKNNDFMGEGFKLNTMKFKGQISQGLVLPIDLLPPLAGSEWVEGDDVTSLLGVHEWEVPEMVGSVGTFKSGRPSFIPKTDETRIQSMPQLLQEFAGLPYYITTKMDGSSYSIGIQDGEVFYTSHNCTLIDDGKSSFIELVKKNGYVKMLQDYAYDRQISSIVLQGEFCGAGIQKNRLKLKEPGWFVFTCIINGERVGFDRLCEVCSSAGVPMVPVEEQGEDLTVAYPTVESLLERAVGIGFNGTEREGVVIRPKEPVYSSTVSGPLSMKVLNNHYLLKTED